jgi:hypothetical protein
LDSDGDSESRRDVEKKNGDADDSDDSDDNLFDAGTSFYLYLSRAGSVYFVFMLIFYGTSHCGLLK